MAGQDSARLTVGEAFSCNVATNGTRDPSGGW